MKNLKKLKILSKKENIKENIIIEDIQNLLKIENFIQKEILIKIMKEMMIVLMNIKIKEIKSIFILKKNQIRKKSIHIKISLKNTPLMKMKKGPKKRKKERVNIFI